MGRRRPGKAVGRGGVGHDGVRAQEMLQDDKTELTPEKIATCCGQKQAMATCWATAMVNKDRVREAEVASKKARRMRFPAGHHTLCGIRRTEVRRERHVSCRFMRTSALRRSGASGACSLAHLAWPE